MAFVKPLDRKCGNCQIADSKTYPGRSVCYLIEKKDDKPVAITVKENRAACGFYRAK